MRDLLTAGLTALDLDLAAADKLARYAELLLEKNKVMNLTAIEGEEATARLHFLDSAALLRYVRLSGKTAADIGSGAGFPGLVAAILAPVSGTSHALLGVPRKRARCARALKSSHPALWRA